jgi:hypothetical protein
MGIMSEEHCVPFFRVEVSEVQGGDLDGSHSDANTPKKITLCSHQWERWCVPVRRLHVTTQNALSRGSHSSKYGGSSCGTPSGFCPLDSNATFKEHSQSSEQAFSHLSCWRMEIPVSETLCS